MSRRHPQDTRTASEYPTPQHKPAPTFTVQAIMVALTVGAVVVASYPVISLVVATMFVGVVLAARVAVARIERDPVNVRVPGSQLEVTVARTAGD
ncbi:hypothetical protein [Haloferax mediterranei]|nr:hypothetical protein [Haloferax mediterranei]MDX5989262.1 hypothetical protein [Haloferax mediterranei ATCC 33500]